MQPKRLLPAFPFPAALALLTTVAWLTVSDLTGLAAVLLWAILLGGIGAAALTALLGKHND